MCLNNFFKLNIFLLFLFGSFVFGAGNFLDYGYIEDTAQLNMKGEYEGNIYKVEVQTGQLQYVTGNDGKEYPCFGIIGTGWTDTMGEVYFQYEGEQAYICSDGKWRGNAKLGAGGWIDFEDGNLSDCNSGNCEDWFSVLDFTTGFDNKFRHSKDGNSGTGKVLTDGVGFWIWDKVSTKQQFRKVFYDHISPEKTQIVVSNGQTADGETSADFSLKVKDGTGNLLEDIFVEDFTLLQSPDVLLNGGKSGLFFAGGKNKINISKLLSGGTLKGEILSVLPQNRKFRSQIEYMDKKVAFTGEINFKPPFDVKLDISDGDGDGKKLIGYKEKGQISVDKNAVVKNFIDFTGNITLSGNHGYNTEMGGMLTEQGEFDLKLFPTNKFEIDNKLGIEYKVDGIYDIETSNGKSYEGISVKNYASNFDYIYPDKEITKSVVSAKNCENKRGNGEELCSFSLVLLNQKNYIVPNVKFDLSVEDANKGIDDKIYKSFDLDEKDDSYTKGLFLSGSSSKVSDNNGSFDFSIFSYKPVHKGSVAITLENINGNSTDKYNRFQGDFSGRLNNINFEKVVDIYFTGAAISDGIVLDSDNSVNIVFEKKDTSASVNSQEYELIGNITGCINCVFEDGEGAEFVGNSFGQKNEKIKISGDVVPEYVSYYDEKYSYKIVGEKGEKEVILDPNIKINGNLNAVPNFFGMDVLGLINKAYNYLNVSNKSNSSVVSSSIPFSDQINEIKKRVYVKKRSSDFINVSRHGYTISEIKNKGEQIYKCNGNKIELNLSEDYEGDNQLFFFDCILQISSNLYADKDSSSLDIVSFSQDSAQIDYSNNNGGWKMNSNIYITSNVKTVNANITTNGSLLMKDGNNDVIIPDRRGNNSLKKQIFIKGKIVARNTVGGGFLKNDKFTLPGGKKVHKSDKIFGVDVNDVAEMYDLNFLRNNYVENNGSYSTGDVSENIIDEYSCSGDSGDKELCKKPIIIKSNPNNKNLYKEN